MEGLKEDYEIGKYSEKDIKGYFEKLNKLKERFSNLKQ